MTLLQNGTDGVMTDLIFWKNPLKRSSVYSKFRTIYKTESLQVVDWCGLRNARQLTESRHFPLLFSVVIAQA
jgi:hypothetical protein